eukprot:scaffold124779_cov43-Prasinocladus_malaysianus.AAC.2
MSTVRCEACSPAVREIIVDLQDVLCQDVTKPNQAPHADATPHEAGRLMRLLGHIGQSLRFTMEVYEGHY